MTTFTILLIDRNDNAPKFNSSEYRVRITELAQVGFALPLFIQAEDKDEVGEAEPIEKKQNKTESFQTSGGCKVHKRSDRILIGKHCMYRKNCRISQRHIKH